MKVKLIVTTGATWEGWGSGDVVDESNARRILRAMNGNVKLRPTCDGSKIMMGEDYGYRLPEGKTAHPNWTASRPRYW